MDLYNLSIIVILPYKTLDKVQFKNEGIPEPADIMRRVKGRTSVKLFGGLAANPRNFRSNFAQNGFIFITKLN